jgi:hypothetical protein
LLKGEKMSNPGLTQGWLPTGRHSRCPQCLNVENLYIRQESTFEVYPASLPGMQPKMAARERTGWVFRCFACGATGPCELKSPEEQGKWVDGLGNEPYE